MICGGSVELLVCGVDVWRWEGVQGCAEQTVELVQDRCMTSVCVCVRGGEGGGGRISVRDLLLHWKGKIA